MCTTLLSYMMHGFVILSACTFLYFSFHILDQGFCDTALSVDRDPNKKLKYARFKDHLFHSLLVPGVTENSVQTSKHCLLRCLKNESCFSTNVDAFPRPDGNVTCELLSTNKYNASEKFQANHSFHHYSIMVSTIYTAIRTGFRYPRHRRRNQNRKRIGVGGESESEANQSRKRIRVGGVRNLTF